MIQLRNFLNSNLLPRTETTPDVFSNKPYYALPYDVSIYSKGFNMANNAEQGKPLIQNLGEMTPEKLDLLLKYDEYEIDQVCVIANEGKARIHIHINYIAE